MAINFRKRSWAILSIGAAALAGVLILVFVLSRGGESTGGGAAPLPNGVTIDGLRPPADSSDPSVYAMSVAEAFFTRDATKVSRSEFLAWIEGWSDFEGRPDPELRADLMGSLPSEKEWADLYRSKYRSEARAVGIRIDHDLRYYQTKVATGLHRTSIGEVHLAVVDVDVTEYSVDVSGHPFEYVSRSVPVTVWLYCEYEGTCKMRGVNLDPLQ